MSGKTLCLVLALLMTTLQWTFADQIYPKPKASEVVVIARVIMDPPLNDKFYSKYWGINSRYITMGTPKSNPEITPSNASLDLVAGGRNVSLWPQEKGVPFIADKISIPKDRMLAFTSFSWYPATIRYFMVRLPLMLKYEIPENENYLYLGTFVYKWKGNQFDVTVASFLDEYDFAVKFVAEKYGKDALLTKVGLMEQKP